MFPTCPATMYPSAEPVLAEDVRVGQRIVVGEELRHVVGVRGDAHGVWIETAADPSGSGAPEFHLRGSTIRRMD